MSEPPRTPAEALRRAIALLGLPALIHLGLGLWGLDPDSTSAVFSLQSVGLALDGLVGLWIGTRLMSGFKRAGLSVRRLAALHMMVGAVLLVSLPELLPTGLAIGGPLLAAWTTAMLGLAVSRLRGPRWLPGVLYFPVFCGLGLGALALSGPWGSDLQRWLQLIPGAALVFSWAALSLSVRRSAPERALLAARLPDGVELVGDTLPLRVRHRVPCQVPYGLRVSSPGEGVPLHNPVLDQLLELSTPAPAAVASMLSQGEDTVLALLHRFPDSRLEEDAVVFEATAAQLAADGRPVGEVLAEGVAAAEALAVLLEGDSRS